MKPIERVSIGGYAFSLDNEACQRLDTYLDELKGFYGRRDGGVEIMEGLEERIAEQLFNRVAPGNVVSLPMIDEILDMLGQPIVLESEAAYGDSKTDSGASSERQAEETPSARQNERKKLYRLSNHRVFGGVCAGLSAFLGIDVVWIRLLWSGLFLLILTNCSFFEFTSWALAILYVLMCLIVPVADTPMERREASRAAEAARSDFWRVLGRFLAVFFGLISILVAFCGLALALVPLFGWNYLPMEWSLYLSEVIPSDMMPFLTNGWSIALFALILLIPFLILMYEGVKWVFNLRSPSCHPGLIMAIVWVVALLVCAARLAAVALPEYFDVPEIFEHAGRLRTCFENSLLDL